jgi:hypothetical protein
MEATIAVIAAVLATLFALSLIWELRNGFQPHVAAYAVGVTLLGASAWALASGLGLGWNSAGYRTFFLLGPVLSAPFFALGSLFLMDFRRTGHLMFLAIGVFSALGISVTTSEPFDGPLPPSRFATDIFTSWGTTPRTLALVSVAASLAILLVLAATAAFRLWHIDNRICIGGILSTVGVAAMATGAIGFSPFDDPVVATTLIASGVAFLWSGALVGRLTSISDGPQKPTAVLVGPSTMSPNLEHNLHLIRAIEARGYEVMCPARDIEEWGEVGFSPVITFQKVFNAIADSELLVVDLKDGYGVEVAAGFARALRVPVIVTAPEGIRISRPLRGVASHEIFYRDAHELTGQLLDPREVEVMIPIKDDES